MNQPTRMRTLIKGIGLLLVIGALALFVKSGVAQELLPGTPLTTDNGNEFRPVWSPDGTKIAFFANRSGDHDIWLMDANGQNQFALTNGASDDRRPSWSSDGEWLVYDSLREGNRNIWIISVNGGEPTQLTFTPGFDSFPSFSPDNQQIAYYSYYQGKLDLMILDLEDYFNRGEVGEPTILLPALADETQGQCTFACHTPQWSPDGTLLAYTKENDREIWVVQASGDNPRRVGDYENNHQLHFPTWSKDGKLIFLSQHTNKDQEPVNDVWEMDVNGNNLNLLFEGIPHGGPLYWNPVDADTVAFHSPRSGNFSLYATNLKNGIAEVLAVEPTPAPSPTEPITEPVPATSVPTPETPSTTSKPVDIPLTSILMGLIALGGIAFSIYWLWEKK